MLKLLRLPFLTGLRVAVGPASRLRRRYADAPAAASFTFVFVSASHLVDFFHLKLGPAAPRPSRPSPHEE